MTEGMRYIEFQTFGSPVIRRLPLGVCTAPYIGQDPLGLTAPTERRWRCTYCLGLRLGEACEGCGAPHHAEQTSPIIPPQPRDTIK